MENNKEQTSKPEGWNVFLPKERKDIRLDKRDQIIIQTLSENARTSLNVLSKMTLLSKNSIANRIKNYERLGLIDGFSTFINIQKLGLEIYTLCIKTKMTLTQKEKFIEHLKKIRFLNQIVTLSPSHWDFVIRVYAKNTEHFDKIITQISSFPNIIHIDIIPSEDWDYNPVNYFNINVNLNRFIKKEDSSFQRTFSSKKEKIKIAFDKKDLEILDILSHNARIPLVEIGFKVNLSPDTVKYRIKNLIEKGIIECFFANLNPYLFGYSTYFFTFQIFNREKIKDIINHLANHPKCTGVMKTKSNWNLCGAILIKDTKELKEFEEEFFAKFENYVHNYEFTQILEQPYYRLFMKEILTTKI